MQDQHASGDFTEGLQTRKRTAEVLWQLPQASLKRFRLEGRPNIAAKMDRKSHSATQIPRLHRSAAPVLQAKTTTNRRQRESLMQRVIRAAVTDHDNDASQTSEASIASTVLPPSSSRAAVITDVSIHSAYKPTGDLSLPALPAPEEPALHTAILPLVHGASSVQNASWPSGDRISG